MLLHSRSCCVCDLSVTNKLNKQLPALRKRLSGSQMDEDAASSLMVCWLSECCVAEHPIMIIELNKFEDGFVDGEVSVMLDLQGLLHDKSPMIFLDGLFSPPGSLSQHI